MVIGNFHESLTDYFDNISLDLRNNIGIQSQWILLDYLKCTRDPKRRWFKVLFDGHESTISTLIMQMTSLYDDLIYSIFNNDSGIYQVIIYMR